MSEPEPDPYVKMEDEWEWEWLGKEGAYVEPGEAEETDWWEQYEQRLAREEAMAESGPMQTEPGRAPLCSVLCMSPHCDFDQASRGVGRVFCVIPVPFLCFRSCLWERLHCPTRFWRPSTGPRADKDRSITPLEQRRSPVPMKTAETETQSAEENVMLEVGVSLCSAGGHFARVVLLCLRPCFWERSPHYACVLRHFCPASATLLESLRSLSPFRAFCVLPTFCTDTPKEDAGRRN